MTPAFLVPGLVTTRVLAGLLLLALAWFAALELEPILKWAQGDFLAFNDFFAQWSFARFARVGPVPSIYDPDALHQFQLGLEPALRKTFPFPYPPTYLFAIWPLGLLPYGAAQVVWDVTTLLLFLWAVLGRDWRMPEPAVVALAPASVMTLAYGQNGFLLSALLVGGTRLMRARPILGGLLLGLASIKPQLGILLPFALVAAGEWRTFVAAGVTTVALASMAVWLWGIEAWAAWLQAAAAHATWVQVEVSDYRKPTVMATLALLGAGSDLAQAVQVGVLVVVVVLVWLCFRRGADGLAVAALQSGTYLAMPFFFVYDLPMLVNALLLFVRSRRGRPWHLAEAGIVALGYMFPALTTLTSRFFYMNTVALVLLFGLLVWRRLEQPSPPTRQRPDDPALPHVLAESSHGDRTAGPGRPGRAGQAE